MQIFANLPVIICFLASIVGGVIVALFNNIWQRNREESKIIREKGEILLELMIKIKDEHTNFYLLSSNLTDMLAAVDVTNKLKNM